MIEAVAENMEIKRACWRKLRRICARDAILTTNTSGLPVGGDRAGICRRRSAPLVRHALLQSAALHAAAGDDCDAGDAIRRYRRGSRFAEMHLGKTVVPAKDRPNFIANRIGAFCDAEHDSRDAGAGADR